MNKLVMAIFLLIVLLALAVADAGTKQKTIQCDEKTPLRVHVSLGRVTVLNFPTKPKDVVPGNSTAFDFKQIKNDLVILGLRPGAHTNAVIYLEDRRCMFDLVTVKSGSDDVSCCE